MIGRKDKDKPGRSGSRFRLPIRPDVKAAGLITAWSLIFIGVWSRWGWDLAFIVLGVLILADLLIPDHWHGPPPRRRPPPKHEN